MSMWEINLQNWLRIIDFQFLQLLIIPHIKGAIKRFLKSIKKINHITYKKGFDIFFFLSENKANCCREEKLKLRKNEFKCCSRRDVSVWRDNKNLKIQPLSVMYTIFRNNTTRREENIFVMFWGLPFIGVFSWIKKTCCLRQFHREAYFSHWFFYFLLKCFWWMTFYSGIKNYSWKLWKFQIFKGRIRKCFGEIKYQNGILIFLLNLLYKKFYFSFYHKYDAIRQ